MSAAWTFGWCQARRSAASFWGALNLALAFALVPTLVGADVDEPAASRQAEILHLLKHDCGSCHGMTLKGGLGPSLRPAEIADLSEDGLIDTILNGRPGTPMAPWRISLDEHEARWLVTRLKEGIDGPD
jgi:cytochrome c55X